MGAIWVQTFLVATLVTAAVSAVNALGRLESAERRILVSWEDEYRLRRCAAALQLIGNIEAAAGHLAATDSGHRQAYGQAGKALARRLADRHGDVGTTGDSCPAADGMAVKLHLEGQGRQPDPWPNWIARLVPDGPWPAPL